MLKEKITTLLQMKAVIFMDIWMYSTKSLYFSKTVFETEYVQTKKKFVSKETPFSDDVEWKIKSLFMYDLKICIIIQDHPSSQHYKYHIQSIFVSSFTLYKMFYK